MTEATIEILSKCVENNRLAQRKLYEYCFRKWISLCLRYHKNEEDARSSLNLSFLKIIDNLPKQDLSTIRFDAWARRIIANTLIDEYRKETKVNEHLISKEEEREIEFFADNHENEGFQKLSYEFLLSLLQQLPDGPRMVFNLFVIEGYSHQEISEKLEIPLGTSKWFLSQAKALMKEKLNTKINQTNWYEVYRS